MVLLFAMAILVMFIVKANFKEAISCYTKSFKLFSKLKLPRGIAYTYTNIGSIYFDQNKLIQALENYKSALSICESIGDKFGISDSYFRNRCCI